MKDKTSYETERKRQSKQRRTMRKGKNRWTRREESKQAEDKGEKECVDMVTLVCFNH